MKKIILSVVAILLLYSCVQAENITAMYSQSYIQHMKVCAPYTEVYTSRVATNNVNRPYADLQATEKIIGWLNGKCLTSTKVYSLELGKDVIHAKCALHREQIKSVTKKMDEINAISNEQARLELKNQLMGFIQDKKICNIQILLEEHEH